MFLMNGLAPELMCFKASKRWVEVSLIWNVPTCGMCIIKRWMNAGFWGGAGLAALVFGLLVFRQVEPRFIRIMLLVHPVSLHYTYSSHQTPLRQIQDWSCNQRQVFTQQSAATLSLAVTSASKCKSDLFPPLFSVIACQQMAACWVAKGKSESGKRDKLWFINMKIMKLS